MVRQPRPLPNPRTRARASRNCRRPAAVRTLAAALQLITVGGSGWNGPVAAVMAVGDSGDSAGGESWAKRGHPTAAAVSRKRWIQIVLRARSRSVCVSLSSPPSPALRHDGVAGWRTGRRGAPSIPEQRMAAAILRSNGGEEIQGISGWVWALALESTTPRAAHQGTVGSTIDQGRGASSIVISGSYYLLQ